MDIISVSSAESWLTSTKESLPQSSRGKLKAWSETHVPLVGEAADRVGWGNLRAFMAYAKWNDKATSVGVEGIWL